MNVADVLSRQAQSRPDAPAVIEGGRVLTYREFDAAVWRAATWFRRQGIAPGDVVGIGLQGGALHLAVSYALARMGAVQVGVPRRESRATRQEIARSLKLAALVGDSLQPDPGWLEPGAPPGERSVRAPGGDGGWAISLSSGTTGQRKAVLHTHAMRAAWQKISLAAIPLVPEERYLALVGPRFYLGLRICMDVHAAGGATILGEPMDTPQDLIAAASHHRATYLMLTPAHVLRLLPLLEGTRLLPGLRILRVGTMTVSDAARKAVRDGLTPNLFLTYGASDAGANPLVCATPETLARHPGCLGFPAPGVDAEVVDDAGAPLPAEQPGHLRFRTQPMPSGYLVGGEAGPGFRDGWFYPGDIGRRSAAGVLYFLGRSDDMMIYEGINIYPAEIESALLEHPAVAEAAAFPLPYALGLDLPAAVVVLREPVEREVLRAWCKQRLGVRAPRSISFARRLPRNEMGKVLKRQLAERLSRRA